MDGPDTKNLPPAPQRGNHQVLKATSPGPQTVVADDSNATFTVRTRQEACVAKAIVDNSPSTALLTSARPGDYESQFKDPATGERVKLMAKDDYGDMSIWADTKSSSSYEPLTKQYVSMKGADKHNNGKGDIEAMKMGEPSESASVHGNASSRERAMKVAEQTRSCVNSSGQVPLTLKKPFFTP